jgi:hypothetical protein
MVLALMKINYLSVAAGKVLLKSSSQNKVNALITSLIQSEVPGFIGMKKLLLSTKTTKVFSKT